MIDEWIYRFSHVVLVLPQRYLFEQEQAGQPYYHCLKLLGINFKGHPDLRKLLLPDNWPEGVYPLRCDYKEWDKEAIRDRGV